MDLFYLVAAVARAVVVAQVLRLGQQRPWTPLLGAAAVLTLRLASSEGGRWSRHCHSSMAFHSRDVSQPGGRVVVPLTDSAVARNTVGAGAVTDTLQLYSVLHACYRCYWSCARCYRHVTDVTGAVLCVTAVTDVLQMLLEM